VVGVVVRKVVVMGDGTAVVTGAGVGTVVITGAGVVVLLLPSSQYPQVAAQSTFI